METIVQVTRSVRCLPKTRIASMDRDVRDMDNAVLLEDVQKERVNVTVSKLLKFL